MFTEVGGTVTSSSINLNYKVPKKSDHFGPKSNPCPN